MYETTCISCENRSFLAYNVKGTLPTSKRTPIFVVLLCTPINCLHIEIWRFSIGLFFGRFKHPQKSLLYRSIGFIIISIKVRVVLISWLKDVPRLFFNPIYAFSALSLKSLRPLFISPDGASRKPSYL